ncbi:serine/threonine-protein kinase-like protein At3g51990 [Coffea arabica]|uniref:Serine/threonine-protein kinase-like protein At3g51990 n=1 Tax=Coffea arabica TaxID=13443 RepID=A0A6P6ULR7_COFAR
MMGYFSCNAETAVATCDSYNFKLTKKLPPSNKIILFSYSDLHSSTNAFSQAHLLGKGSYGSVYKAHLVLHPRQHLVAAVKITKPTSTNAPAENEIEILSHVHHPRLVNLLGHSVDSHNNKLIVVEYMPNGSLYDLLHRSTRPPGWTRRVRFALQLAKALHFLHSSNPPVIHRDVKSSNVLIDANFNARLSDFGLALRGHVEDVRVKCTPPAGTLGYLDPGYLVPGDLSTKSDVFSFGILLLEIISGRNAIDVNYSPPSVVDWAVPAIKAGDFAGLCDPRIGPPEDEAALLQLAVLAAKCVRTSGAKRPAMAEVVESLKGVCKRVNYPVWNNLGRSVDCVRDPTRVTTKYEPLDESGEMIKTVRVSSRRTRKVSSVGSLEAGGSAATGRDRSDRIGRSRSIGSFREIEFGALDLSSNDGGVAVGGVAGRRRRGGLAVKMPIVRLSKSRSMGMLQSTRLANNNNNNNNGGGSSITGTNNEGVKLVWSPDGRELEESKLLVDSRNETLQEGYDPVLIGKRDY